MCRVAKLLTYDALGRLETVTVPVDDNAANNQTSTTEYNEQGQKIAQVDARGRRTSFEYDSLGRTTKRTLPNGKSETMTYNVLGQVTSKTDFKGKTTTFVYDVRGRLLSKTPDGSLNEEPITFSYPNELTKVVTRGSNVTTYRSDAARGWLNVVENSGVVNGRIEYSYDAAGNKTSVESVAIKDGVEQRNKTLYRYDALGRTDLVTFSDGSTTSYSYDIVGNRETITRSNGTGTLYRFDNQNRLVSQQNVRGAGTPGATVVSSFVYDVRADGKRTGVREQVLNPLNSSVAMTTRTIGYDFDKAGRLTRETREERQSLRAGGESLSTRISGYEFDEVSNRKKLTTNSYNGIGDAKTLIATSTIDYNYNSANELTEEITTVGANTTSKTYSYDDNGAQTSITSNDVVTPYAYDFEGKLLSVGDATSSARSSYVYDGDGNRLSAIVTTGGVAKTVRYLNDTNTAYVQVVEERDENGVLQARYDYGDMDLQKLYRRDANGSYLSRWFLNDGLESTRQLVDANGVVTDSYAYDAFGSTLQRTGETENTRLFNAQQQDASGLYFLRARYYNTGNGRFLSHDPLLGSSDDPVTLHRYLYTPQDPINYSDPSGRESLGSVMASMGARMVMAANYARAAAPAVAGVTNFIGASLFTAGMGQHIAKSGMSAPLFDGFFVSAGAEVAEPGRAYSIGGGLTVYVDRESREFYYALGFEASASFSRSSDTGPTGSFGFSFNTRGADGKTDAYGALSGFGFTATYPLATAGWASAGIMPILAPYIGIGKLAGMNTVTYAGDVMGQDQDGKWGNILQGGDQDVSMSFSRDSGGGALGGGISVTRLNEVHSLNDAVSGAGVYAQQAALRMKSSVERSMAEAEADIKRAYGIR